MGERRQGHYMVYASGVAVPSGNYFTLLGAGTNSFYPSGSGLLNLIFDMGSPRVIDEIRVRLSGSAGGMGQWAVDGSHDMASWTELAAPFQPATNILQTWPFHSNTTAYRFYRLRRPSGNSNILPYWRTAEFRIDDNEPNDGWFSPYSVGDRGGFIGLSYVPANLLQAGTIGSVVTAGNIDALTTLRFANGRTGAAITMEFPEPIALTGFKWAWQLIEFDHGTWCVESSEDGGSTWDTVVETFSFTASNNYGFPSPQMVLEFENTNAANMWRLRQTGGSTQNLLSGRLVLKVGGSVTPPVEVVEPLGGGLRIVGKSPRVVGGIEIYPGAGGLKITGHAPEVTNLLEIQPLGGSLQIVGRAPIVAEVTLVYASPGGLEIQGQQPIIYTDTGTLSSQFVVAALGDQGTPAVAASQYVVAALGGVIPQARASQFVVAALVDDASCVTERCQLWTIQRRDGEIFRYTSLDVDFWYKGRRFKACGSMDPSAAQTGSALGDTGSVSLSGLITDEGISEADLFGGLFDDAFVTIDLVNWQGPSRKPRRIASGWVGKVTHGPAFHTMEILSASARLEQTALVQLVSPSCRWRFGDSRCSVNVEAMKITGTVVRLANRGDMILDVETPPDDGRIWKSGRLRFISGPAAGIEAEYKEINFTTGQVVLWTPAGLAPMAGDAVEILPGCDLTRDGGCTAYSNIINFGGYPDVPGTDSAMETPDAKL